MLRVNAILAGQVLLGASETAERRRVLRCGTSESGTRRERGATPIHELAAVFDGKRAHVRAAGEPRKPAPKLRAKSQQ